MADDANAALLTVLAAVVVTLALITTLALLAAVIRLVGSNPHAALLDFIRSLRGSIPARPARTPLATAGVAAANLAPWRARAAAALSVVSLFVVGSALISLVGSDGRLGDPGAGAVRPTGSPALTGQGPDRPSAGALSPEALASSPALVAAPPAAPPTPGAVRGAGLGVDPVAPTPGLPAASMTPPATSPPTIAPPAAPTGTPGPPPATPSPTASPTTPPPPTPTVNPTPRPPEITTWVVAPSEGSRPLHVVFEATLVGGDRWVLSFGDDKVIEGTETVLREAHTYPHVGMYTATLEVFGPGGKASAGAVIVVHE